MSFESENAAVDVGLAKKDAGIVHEIPRRKIVCAIDHDVISGQQVERVVGRQRHVVDLDGDLRVERIEPVAGRLQLRATDIWGSVDNLALEIAVVNDIEVDDPDAPDAGRGQIQRHRRAETASTDAQHTGRLELQLPVHADLGHDEVATVPSDFVVAQRHKRRPMASAPVPPATDGTMLIVSPSETGVASFCRYRISSSLR